MAIVPAKANIDPVTFQGAGLVILHDGSPTAFNPHIEAGRRLLMREREACCVEAPATFHGLSEPFVFHSDEQRHLIHESARFVINPRTGAFLSTTTLRKPNVPLTSPDAYVDTDITPAIALDDDQISASGVKVGDRVLVQDRQFDRSVWTVFAVYAGDRPDGTAHTELSPAAAEALLIPLDSTTKEPKESGYKLSLTLYPGSGFGTHFPHGVVQPVAKTKVVNP
jgi:hypothetical protein